MGFRRVVTVGLVVLAGLGFVASPAGAAPPDPSGVVVDDTSLAPGQTFTVAVELFNPRDFAIVGAAASLRLVEVPISERFELVSCSGSVSNCFAISPATYRGPVGELAPGASATVTFTLRVVGAGSGSYTVEHQLVGEAFSFAAGLGPVVTVSAPEADLAVGLDASPRGILTSRITYTLTVTNNGPGDATGVRVDGTLASGLAWGGGDGCVRVDSRGVRCEFASVPSGGTVSASFRADAGLLAIGSFTTSVARVASSPFDPISSNDSARRTCAALTGLLVRC